MMWAAPNRSPRCARRATQDKNCFDCTVQSVERRGSQQLSQAPHATLEGLVEVAQLNGAAAFGGFGVAQDLPQLLARDALLALERIAGVGIDFLLDEELGGADILQAEIQRAIGRIAVASGASGFLVVALEAARQIVMR